MTEIYAYYTANVYTVILEKCGGTGGSSSVEATYGSPMPSAVAPTRTGYTFQGYYQFENGQGKQYYNSNMSSAEKWDKAENNFTLYAYWTGNQYIVTLDNGIYGKDVCANAMFKRKQSRGESPNPSTKGVNATLHDPSKHHRE